MRGKKGGPQEEISHLRSPCFARILAAQSCPRFFAVLHIELLIDAAHLRFHRVEGDDQRLSDLRVRVSSSQQAQDPLLLGRERSKWQG
jgi:hypothetical protein